MPAYSLAARCTTEIIGTAAGVYVGEASIANALLPSAKGQGMGFGWIAFAYALAFFFPALFFGHVSAILNPAFCAALLVTGRLTPAEFFALSFSELLGGFLGGLLVWLHWIPHLKTVPEPPPALEQDGLIRKRDSITKCGVQIASYNTQQERSTRRAVGGLVGCFRDVAFYLSHHHPHLPEGVLPFAHRRSKEDAAPLPQPAREQRDGGGGGAKALSQEELHSRLCEEEGGVAGRPVGGAGQGTGRKVVARGGTSCKQQQQKQQGGVLEAELQKAGGGGGSAGGQHSIRAVAGGVGGSAAAAVGEQGGSVAGGGGEPQGASPPDSPRRGQQFRTPPYEQSNPSSTSSLQALLGPGGAAAGAVAAAAPQDGAKAALIAAGHHHHHHHQQQGASQEEEQQRRKAKQAYQAALIADQNVKLSIFATRPAIYAPFFNFLVEFMSTILLVAGILLIQRHCDALAASDPVVYGVYTQGLSPFFVGLWVVVLVLGAGGPTGLAVNPARDLGPRLAFAVLPIPNKGPVEWHYAWIPVVAPLFGGTCGGAIADALGRLR